MEKIATLFKLPPIRKPQSERASLVQFFLEKINGERKGTEYKEFTPAAMGVKLSHLSLQDIYYLKSICTDAERRGQPFSKVFFGSLKAPTLPTLTTTGTAPKNNVK